MAPAIRRKKKRKSLTPEERRKYQRRYYQLHKEKAKEYQRLYNLTHKRKDRGSNRGTNGKGPAPLAQREKRRKTVNIKDLQKSSMGETWRMIDKIIKDEQLFTM